MYSIPKHYFIYLISPFFLFSCSNDDDGIPGGDLEPYATFDISGGLEGEYVGENTLVSVHESHEDGTSLNWSTTRPQDEDPFWRLEFHSEEGVTEAFTPGTYVLGNLEDFIDGNADLMVAFQVHEAAKNWPSLWGALGSVDGTLIITEVQEGVYDNGTGAMVTGTFEFTASDNNEDGILETAPLDDIVVTDGAFRAKMATF